jgi:hypothetical protein
MATVIDIRIQDASDPHGYNTKPHQGVDYHSRFLTTVPEESGAERCVFPVVTRRPRNRSRLRPTSRHASINGHS